MVVVVVVVMVVPGGGGGGGGSSCSSSSMAAASLRRDPRGAFKQCVSQDIATQPGHSALTPPINTLGTQGTPAGRNALTQESARKIDP